MLPMIRVRPEMPWWTTGAAALAEALKVNEELEKIILKSIGKQRCVG